MASNISNVSSTISSLQSQIDQQVVSAIPSTNSLIQQVYQLNQQIKTATAGGRYASALQDQRDTALTSLAQIMGIQRHPAMPTAASMSRPPTASIWSATPMPPCPIPAGRQNGTYGNIQIQDINPQTGQLIGQASALDPHLIGGSLKGLIDMRDQTLGGLAQSLGNFAQTDRQAFNAQSNANAAYPPPTSLTGRDTGLLSTDALNFTGKTTIAVTDSSGNLVVARRCGFRRRHAVGGWRRAPASIGTTVGSFTTALNTALGANGSASFANGQLSISANGGNGIVVQDSATTPIFARRHRLSRNSSASTMFSSRPRPPSSRPACRHRTPAAWRRAASSRCR